MRRTIGAALITAAPVCGLADCPPATAQQSEEPPKSVVASPGEGQAKADILYAPVPFSQPSTGPGIAGGVIAFYNPNREPNQWRSGGGIVLTERGSKGVAAFHSMSWGADSFRLDAGLAYFDEDEDYYGSGAAAGDRDDPLRLSDQHLNARLRVLRRVSRVNFLGGEYRLTTHSAAPDDEDMPATPPPPADQLGSTQSMIGPVLVHDTRDDQSQPRFGVYATASWLFGFRSIGDSFTHNKLSIAGNLYTAISPRTVFAARASLCSAGGEVAYYALCEFGASNDLRGYPTGRYRDRASWALQAEMRRAIASRWGLAGFVGFGGIAPSVGDILADSRLLPAIGAGVRYRPFKNNSVQLRVDFAVGDDASGLYVGIGEAF